MLNAVFDNGCVRGDGSATWSAWQQSGGDPCSQESVYESQGYNSEEDCLAAAYPGDPELPSSGEPEGCCCDTSSVDLCATTGFEPTAPCLCSDFGWTDTGEFTPFCQPPRQSATLVINEGVNYEALYEPPNGGLEFTGAADFGSGTENFRIVIDPTVDPPSVTIFPDSSPPCIFSASLSCTDGVWTGGANADCGGGMTMTITFHGTF